MFMQIAMHILITMFNMNSVNPELSPLSSHYCSFLLQKQATIFAFRAEVRLSHWICLVGTIVGTMANQVTGASVAQPDTIQVLMKEHIWNRPYTSISRLFGDEIDYQTMWTASNHYLTFVRVVAGENGLPTTTTRSIESPTPNTAYEGPTYLGANYGLTRQDYFLTLMTLMGRYYRGLLTTDNLEQYIVYFLCLASFHTDIISRVEAMLVNTMRVIFLPTLWDVTSGCEQTPDSDSCVLFYSTYEFEHVMHYRETGTIKPRTGYYQTNFHYGLMHSVHFALYRATVDNYGEYPEQIWTICIPMSKALCEEHRLMAFNRIYFDYNLYQLNGPVALGMGVAKRSTILSSSIGQNLKEYYEHDCNKHYFSLFYQKGGSNMPDLPAIYPDGGSLIGRQGRSEDVSETILTELNNEGGSRASTILRRILTEDYRNI